MMLSISLRRMYVVSEKVWARNLRNQRKNLDIRGANPGLDERIKAFQKEGIKIEDDDAEEFIENSETDFYNVGEAYNEHLNETLIGKYRLRHQIVKEKYFKENMPNLLTWSEKEQIRHLVTTQPNEWTLERIAESFPVTEQVAKKLLKIAWKPANIERIARHDASAMRNWKELKEGTLNIPEHLRQHFLKFSDRTIPPLNDKSIKIEIKKDENLGEYEQIIHRCASNEKTQCSEITINDKYESASKHHIKNETQRMTLEELKLKIKKDIESGNKVNVPDQMISDTIIVEASKIPPKVVENEIIESNREERNLTQVKEEHTELVNISDYPERIRIPKKAFKKGATYQVNDCFYDDDGRFLYRVIGMSS